MNLFSSIVALAVVATAVLCSQGEALAQRRVALVVGSNDYADVPKLERAVNDANAVAAAFGELGFDVVSLLDPTRSQFSQALAEFEARVQPGDIAAFFFAGHGVSLDGGNYLLPIDVPNVSDGQKNRLKNEGFLADEIADRVKERGAATTVMILDACRNNPFRDTAGRSIGGSRGLARMDTRPGMFVMFSAGTGQVALDRLGADDTDPIRSSPAISSGSSSARI